ncbi:unnamed protein product [Laminaria digitata]
MIAQAVCFLCQSWRVLDRQPCCRFRISIPRPEQSRSLLTIASRPLPMCLLFCGTAPQVLQRYDSSHGLPPCLVHCFTGSKEELAAYVDMGFFISVAGSICRQKNGAELREAVKLIPLDRLMVETDAPYLGFTGCRKGHSNPKKTNPNVPSALPAVVRALAECLGLPFDQVAQATLRNSRAFFGMMEIAEIAPVELHQ